MKHKATRGLVIGLIFISTLCVAVFSYLAVRMNRRGAGAIGEIGSVYMAGMSEQAAAHFGTAIQLRLSQVGGIGGLLSAGGREEPHHHGGHPQLQRPGPGLRPSGPLRRGRDP